VPPKRKRFFAQEERPEDVEARIRDVASLLPAKRLVIQEVGEERVRPNPFQARHVFTGLDELAESIRTHGFTTRLRVRPDPAQSGYFQLVYGERRLRAARIAGLSEIPCEIAEHTDDELIEIGLAENIQRQDLTPLEEAQAFQLFIDQRNYSVRRLAERIGKDKSYVEDRLALLRTPEDVQQLIVERPDALRIAREIAKLPSLEDRRPLIAAALSGELTTADIRSIVRDTAVAAPLATVPTPIITLPAPVTSTSERTSVPQSPVEVAVTTTVTRMVQRSLERDVQMIRNILSRWQLRLLSGDATQEQVRIALEQVLLDAKELTNALEPSEQGANIIR